MAKHSSSLKSTALGLLEEGVSGVEIADQLGISSSTVRTWKRRAKEARPSGGEHTISGPTHIPPNFFEFAEKATDGPDVIKTLSMLADRTENHNSDTKDYRRIAIETNKPIAVMNAADLHLGGMDISYRALADHYNFLLNNDDFYIRLLGDTLNLMIMHKTVGARHDILSPNEQMELFRSMIRELVGRGKLLWVGWGNHDDEFTERSAGFGLVKFLTKGNIPYFRGLGYVDLVVGEQTYPVAFAHKTRFHSFMNALHGNKRMEQMHAEYFGPDRPIAREYITGHTHYPAVSWEGMVPSDRIYFIKCGTFKTNCLYSQRYFGQGRIGVPTTVYHPDRIEHLVFPTPWEAKTYMEGVKHERTK